MFLKPLFTITIAAALALGPVGRAAADVGDALLGGVVGGVVGGIIVNEANKPKPPRTTTRTVVVKPRVESPQRVANRETQTALNYFGYNAGAADGVMGRKTSAAIASYQTFMGYPPTGTLTPFEREILIGAYRRGIAGTYETVQLTSTDPLGPRALLVAQRDILTGTPPAQTAPPATTAATTPAPEQGLALLPVPANQTSLAAFCATSGSTGGTADATITLATMTDPDPVLSQQFCIARSDAIASGAVLAANVPGVSAAQIDQQCAQFGPTLSAYVADLSISPRADVLSDVRGFVADSGMDQAQLAGTARICLGTGYRTEAMDVALGSALLLAAMGEPAYGELAGHHLQYGIGVGERRDLALDWYVWTTNAIADGAAPVFQRNDPDRSALIDQAVYLLGGGPRTEVKPIETSGAKAKLPVFSTPKN